MPASPAELPDVDLEDLEKRIVRECSADCGCDWEPWNLQDKRAALAEIRRLRARVAELGDELGELVVAAAEVCEDPGHSDYGDPVVELSELRRLRELVEAAQARGGRLLTVRARIVHRRTRVPISEELRLVVRERLGSTKDRVAYDLVAPRGFVAVRMTGECGNLAEHLEPACHGSWMQYDLTPIVLGPGAEAWKVPIVGGYVLEHDQPTECHAGDVRRVSFEQGGPIFRFTSDA